MHLLGFIIRIYHDARSPERQIHFMFDKSVPKILSFFEIIWKNTVEPDTTHMTI